MTKTLHIIVQMVVVTAGAFCMAQTRMADVQIGVRFNAHAALQWSGNTIFVQDDSVKRVRTSVRAIEEIWPGPIHGSFAVLSNEGLGLLIGHDIVSVGHLCEGRCIVRSSRPDMYWLAFDSGNGRSRIVEGHRYGVTREVAGVRGAIADFDVAVNGVVAYVTGEVIEIKEPGKAAQRLEPIPSLGSRNIARVFITTDASEVAVIAGDRLYRHKRDGWAEERFDRTKQALVRDAVSRRVALEPKLQ